jgi:L-histidine N-alpha-methyltransferase
MNQPVVDVYLAEDHIARALVADVRAGLSTNPKTLPPKWFYDAVGSELFEEITRLPEYYPTRAEREILTEHAADIAGATMANTLVELGSGSSDKTRLLLDALIDAGSLRRFVPLDVSESALRAATSALAVDYPDITVHGVVGDFSEHLALVPGDSPRLVAFLGGTIGNLVPDERAKFLAAMRDLVKDSETIVRAYDDSAGVTAEFNRNVLRVLNRDLNADFEVHAFEHVALWDAEQEWIEMRLRATRDMRVRIPDVGIEVSFAAGEELRTEVSAKFRREGVATELADAGFSQQAWWTDGRGRFGMSLAVAA